MTAATRQVLSREIIASKALELTDSEGLDGLSMRKLGAELGVEAMSLYHYVSSKDDLLDALVELLCAEVELPCQASSTDASWDAWKDEVRSALMSLYTMLRRHPAAVELMTHRPINGPHGLELLFWSYRQCQRLGLGSLQASQMFQLCVGYVLGRAASEIGLLARMRDDPAGVEGVVEDLEVKEFLAAGRAMDRDHLFHLGLDSLFEGFIKLFDINVESDVM